MLPRSVLTVLVALVALGGVGAATTSPGNDAFDGAEAMALLPTYADVRSTSGATLEAGEPTPCGRMQATVWYVLDVTGVGAAWVDVDTGGSSFDTSLAVYQGDELANLTLVECNDDTVGYGLQSRVIFFADPGATYRVQVGGYLGAAGTLHVNAAHTVAHPCESGPLVHACP